MAYYEPGRYLATITDQGFGKEQNEKGTPYFYLTIQPEARVHEEGGEKQYEPLRQKEHQRDIKLHLTKKTMDFQIEALRRLGWGGTSFAEIDPERGGLYSFKGKEIEVSCEHNEGRNGKFYDNFRLSFQSYGPDHQRPEELIDQLDKEFAEILNATKQESAPLPDVSPEGKDDIPF